MTHTDVIRVMIVDDHDMVRAGLVVFFESTSDLEIVGQASSGEEAVELCASVRPDVILMDINLPGGMDGVAATRAIRKSFPQVRVIALTSFRSEELVWSALSAGATGYLLKDTTSDDLHNAIRAVHGGASILSPEALQIILEGDFGEHRPEVGSDLTRRELEVLALLVEGLTNAQIAQRLSLSGSTVKNHVSSVLARLEVRSRTEAATLALKLKLVTDDDLAVS